jgi:TP901 family phage tail tape measure protein
MSVLATGGLLLKLSLRAENIFKVLEKVGTSFKKALETPLGKVAVAGTASIAGIAFALKSSVSEAARFEQQFARVKKTTADSFSESGLEAFRGELLRLSTDLPVSNREITGVAAVLGQLDVKAAFIPKLTETMIRFGVATNISATEAGTALAKLTTVLRRTEESTPRLASAIVRLGNTTATTERDILRMALRMGAAASQVGITDSTVLALAATMSETGVLVEAGGSAMSSVFAEISQAVSKSSAKLELFAKTAGYDTGESFKKIFASDPSKGFIDFLEGLDNLQHRASGALPTLQALGGVFTNVRVRMALLNTAGAMDKLRENIKNAEDAIKSEKDLLRESDLQFKTFTNSVTRLSNAFKRLKVILGLEILPILTSIVDSIRDLLVAFGDMQQSAIQSEGFIKKFAVSFAKILPLAVLVGILAAAFAVMVVVMGGVAAAAAAVATGLTVIAAGIAAVLSTIAVFAGLAAIFAAITTGTGQLAERLVRSRIAAAEFGMAVNENDSYLTRFLRTAARHIVFGSQFASDTKFQIEQLYDLKLQLYAVANGYENFSVAASRGSASLEQLSENMGRGQSFLENLNLSSIDIFTLGPETFLSVMSSIMPDVVDEITGGSRKIKQSLESAFELSEGGLVALGEYRRELEVIANQASVIKDFDLEGALASAGRTLIDKLAASEENLSAALQDPELGGIITAINDILQSQDAANALRDLSKEFSKAALIQAKFGDTAGAARIRVEALRRSLDVLVVSGDEYSSSLDSVRTQLNLTAKEQGRLAGSKVSYIPATNQLEALQQQLSNVTEELRIYEENLVDLSDSAVKDAQARFLALSNQIESLKEAKKELKSEVKEDVRVFERLNEALREVEVRQTLLGEIFDVNEAKASAYSDAVLALSKIRGVDDAQVKAWAASFRAFDNATDQLSRGLSEIGYGLNVYEKTSERVGAVIGEFEKALRDKQYRAKLTADQIRDLETSLKFLRVQLKLIEEEEGYEKLEDITKNLNKSLAYSLDVFGQSGDGLQKLKSDTDAYNKAIQDSFANKNVGADTRQSWIDQRDALQNFSSTLEGFGSLFDATSSAITSTFNQSVEGIITGTLTLEDAFRNLGKNLVLSWINTMAQLAIQAAIGWLKIQAISALAQSEMLASLFGFKAAETGITVAGEGAKSSATAAGSGVRQGIAAEEAATSIGAKMSEVVAFVTGEAAKLTAGLTTSLTLIPKMAALAAVSLVVGFAAITAGVGFSLMALGLLVALPLMLAFTAVMTATIPILVPVLLATAAAVAALATAFITLALAARSAAIAQAASAVAGIPYVGPALAIAAAGAVSAAISSFSAAPLARRGAFLESDTLLMAHKGEMVLPPQISSGLRRLITEKSVVRPEFDVYDTQRSESGPSTVIIQAWDSKDVKKFVNQNGSAIIRASRNQYRKFNPDARNFAGKTR